MAWLTLDDESDLQRLEVRDYYHTSCPDYQLDVGLF
jgi:hypothetical protein